MNHLGKKWKSSATEWSVFIKDYLLAPYTSYNNQYVRLGAHDAIGKNASKIVAIIIIFLNQNNIKLHGNLLEYYLCSQSI